MDAPTSDTTIEQPDSTAVRPPPIPVQDAPKAVRNPDFPSRLSLDDFAQSTTDVLDGVPFIGRLYLIDEDGGLSFQETFNESRPGTIDGVRNAFRNGRFCVKHPHRHPREIQFAVGQIASKVSEGGKRPNPPVDDPGNTHSLTALRNEARREFAADLEREKRLRTQAEDDLKRAQDQITDLRATNHTLETNAATLRAEIAEAKAGGRTEAFQAQQMAFQEREEINSKHFREKEKLKNDVRALESKNALLEFQIKTGDAPGNDLFSKLIDAVTETGVLPMVMDAFAGAGHDDFPVLEGAPTEEQPPMHQPQQPHPLNNFVSQVAQLALGSVRGQLHHTPDYVLNAAQDAMNRLAGGGIHVGNEQWRQIAWHLLSTAAQEQLPIDRVVAYLMPIIQPWETAVKSALTLGAKAAMPMLQTFLGGEIPPAHKPYVEQVLGEVKSQLRLPTSGDGAITPDSDLHVEVAESQIQHEE